MTPVYDQVVAETGIDPQNPFAVEDFIEWDLEAAHPISLRELLCTLEFNLKQREEREDGQERGAEAPIIPAGG